MEKKNTFDKFTNQYALSKTLRFELKPEGKTLANMKNHIYKGKKDYDPDLKTFLHDQEIEDAYQALKPVLDRIHEDFITQSLESEEVNQIDFSGYFSKYEKQEDDKGEKYLREKIGKAFIGMSKKWKSHAGKTEKGKDIFKESGYKILTESGILLYIKQRAEDFKDLLSKKDLFKALSAFEGFFTYFGGFNQNRENYYVTKDEKATAVATRIVHENLPKFCDNIVIFESRKKEYEEAYDFLKNLGRSLVNKEGDSLFPIFSDIFEIEYFKFCLSQKQIETYNEKIGNANFIINLYNQVKKEDKNAKRLSLFKTLYKQIGCGKKKALFFALTHYAKKEAEDARKKRKDAFSVEEMLNLAKQAGEKYFKKGDDESDIKTIEDFLQDIEKRESYDGIYWSKRAINSLSNYYFASWQSILRFVEENAKDYKTVASYDEKREEKVKINDAVEISKLFEIFEKVAVGEKWWESFFRKSIWEDVSKLEIIKKSETPGKALLNLLIADIRLNMKGFRDEKGIFLLQEYKSPESKEKIKAWMDLAKNTMQMFKYFHVNEAKTKGMPLDSMISNTVKVLIFEAKLDEKVNDKEVEVEWFTWYDALRNYLTRKPQDNAKENKLKLNFENGNLLGGWSDGQEKSKGAVLLRKNGLYYVGILKKKNLFNTEKGKESEVYKNPTDDCGRLILANLKFQTLAGKGFLGEFKMSYGEMGKKDSQMAVESLKKIIKDRYSNRYHLLDRIANTSYADKKTFDKDIQETLKECYVCEFSPIDWKKIEEYVDTGEMYLFHIFSKDFSEKATGRKDLQTLYWGCVFKKNSPFQLNGGAEIFYRKQAIKEKKVKKGYEGKSWVIENKRFTEEDGKFFFHCPIKLNYKATGNSNPKYALPEANKNINEQLSLSESIHFLGIDRGEKHLAYYSLVNQKGEILEQGTLNLLFTDKDGNSRSIKKDGYVWNRQEKEWEPKEFSCKDYNKLLEAVVSNRDMARENWQTIGTIKELKEGYISQVVRLIADLSVKHSAFIVLEDLNTGFKRERQKIEKAVYQKLELALAKKLNLLVNKTAKNGEIGSVTNALQLTPPVNNYGDIENRKQVGIMPYTRANYTSQTDPVTGWRKSIYLKTGSGNDIKEQIINNFSNIYFDGEDYVFEYEKGEMIDLKTGEIKTKKWKLYSGKNGKSLDRFRDKRGKDKNEWTIKPQNIVEILDSVFASFDKKQSLLEQIKTGKELTKFNEHAAWESFRFAIDLIQQIRNTGTTERDNDFILSPVRNEDGNHFDSREYWDKEQKGEEIDLPSSGDANGAYNIARKGLLMNEHIKQWIEDGQKKYKGKQDDLNLFISDPEWDMYLSSREIWGQQLPKFSSRKAMEEEFANNKKSKTKK